MAGIGPQSTPVAGLQATPVAPNAPSQSASSFPTLPVAGVGATAAIVAVGAAALGRSSKTPQASPAPSAQLPFRPSLARSAALPQSSKTAIERVTVIPAPHPAATPSPTASRIPDRTRPSSAVLESRKPKAETPVYTYKRTLHNIIDSFTLVNADVRYSGAQITRSQRLLDALRAQDEDKIVKLRQTPGGSPSGPYCEDQEGVLCAKHCLNAYVHAMEMQRHENMELFSLKSYREALKGVSGGTEPSSNAATAEQLRDILTKPLDEFGKHEREVELIQNSGAEMDANLRSRLSLADALFVHWVPKAVYQQSKASLKKVTESREATMGHWTLYLHQPEKNGWIHLNSMGKTISVQGGDCVYEILRVQRLQPR